MAIAVAGCGATGTRSDPTQAQRQPSIRSAASPAATVEVEPASAPPPRVGILDVVDVVHTPSSEAGTWVVAVQLRGAVGTSAVFRSIEIQAWAETVSGSRCDEAPVPRVLHPGHDEAMRPTLSDQTRTAIVRSLGAARTGLGARQAARFRYGPVPSLNGDFDGWVSFHWPAASATGFCAFDVRGIVVTIANQTATAEIPALRIDTRGADD